MAVRIRTGDSEPITFLALDTSSLPLSGKTDIKARIWRASDSLFLDWSDMTFKAFGSVTQLLQVLSEIGSTGEYLYLLDTSVITNPTTDDAYQVTLLQDTGTDVANLPAVGELKIGQWVDELVLTKKILKNRLELDDGDSNNWTLYDDDDTTILLTFDVTDKNGDPITQPIGVPSNRTRGT